MDDDPPRVPKYRAPDFMRKEIALFNQARTAAQLLRRYGDDDDPLPAVAPIASVRSVQAIRRRGELGD